MINKKPLNRISILKKLFLVPLVALLACTSNSSEEKPDPTKAVSKELSSIASDQRPAETPYETVDEMPQYPGGEAALMELIGKNIKYPEKAVAGNIQGRVIIRFIVTKEGKTSSSSVVKSADPLLDAEALRVIESLSGWTPGKLDGKNVDTWYMIPVTFKLK